MIEPIVIGLGGNIGTMAELVERFERARAEIACLYGDVLSAPLYSTAAIGPLQAPFLNSALLATSDARPATLIASLLEIERALGRTRDGERFGPRMIDLDVLVWGTRVIHTPALEVPHPRLAERRFALEPLAALLGEDFEIPGAGPISKLLDRVHEQQDCEQIAARW